MTLPAHMALALNALGIHTPPPPPQPPQQVWRPTRPGEQPPF